MKIALTEMSVNDFKQFISIATIAYAQNKVKNGDWKLENSLMRSKKAFIALLPDGLKTRDHFLKNIEDANGIVGFLWYAIEQEDDERIVFLYEITVFEEYRNKGYGTKAMKAFMQIAKDLRIERTALHVFGFNSAAIKFYKRLGFKMTDYTMQHFSRKESLKTYEV